MARDSTINLRGGTQKECFALTVCSSIVTQPNMYARGILFGKMKYELGDHSYVRCPENDLVADLEFKTKGYFSGTYNAIGGSIKCESTGEVYYELSGLWNGEMYIRDVAVSQQVFFIIIFFFSPVPHFMRDMLLTFSTDGTERAALQCDECETYATRKSTAGRTDGPRIAETLA